MKDRLVAVRYLDIGCDQTEMFSKEELQHRQGVQFVAFGLLMVDTPEKVVVVTEVCENGNYRGATTILRPLVLAVTDLGSWPAKGRKAGTRRAPIPPVASPLSVTLAEALASSSAAPPESTPTPTSSS
jgi:hypothetical protein